MKQHSFTFSYIQTGDYCNCSYCFTAVVFEVNSVWSCERRVHVNIYTSSVRYLLVMLIIQVIIYRLPSYSQPDSLIPSIFNAHFTKNYVTSVWDLFLNIYFIADPHNKAQIYQILFTCISMKNLKGKQNLRPEKSIYSYFVKFDWYNLRGVYWIISCFSLVPLCFPRGDTLKWVMCWDSTADNIVWPQCTTGRW